MKQRDCVPVALITALTLLLASSLPADGPASAGSILEAISNKNLGETPEDSLSAFTMTRSGETGEWILEHPDATRQLRDRFEELARFHVPEVKEPYRLAGKRVVQVDMTAQYILVGTLGRSESNRGIQVWGLVQEVSSKRLGDTAVFIPMGSSSDPSVAIAEAGVLANEDIRSSAAVSSSPNKLFGICDADCEADLNACTAGVDSQLSSCLAGCVPSLTPGALALCITACEGSWVIGRASCTSTWLTCTTLQALACPASPILLDLDRNNFHLAGLDDSVLFDIDADGQDEEVGWTRWDQEDVFLCLDRNENGRIDDGTELFGDHTPLQFGTTAPNGYIALAEFDMEHLGGSDDGFIDEDDAIYGDLCVWRDSNHNGHSEAEELSNLATHGIERIGLRYSSSKRVDSHGNEMRYWSDAWIRTGDRSKHTSTVDVWFVKVPE